MNTDKKHQHSTLLKRCILHFCITFFLNASTKHHFPPLSTQSIKTTGIFKDKKGFKHASEAPQKFKKLYCRTLWNKTLIYLCVNAFLKNDHISLNIIKLH